MRDADENREEKNGRVKSWGREARERRDYRLSPRVWIMRCSHNAKIWLAYARSVDNTLSSFEMRVTYCMQECLYNLALWNRNFGTGANQSVWIASHRPWCSYDSANSYGKSWIYQGIFGKAFHFEPECERVSDFAAYKHFVNSIAGEQFWNMNWLNLAFLTSIWKIKPDFNLKLSAAIGKHVTTVGWSPMSNT